MGQLTEALKATKELRKQFVKKAVKKISKRDQKIIDAIEKSDFGCQKENVFVFAEALLERGLSRKSSEKDSFKFVKGAALVHLGYPGSSSKGMIVIDTKEHLVYWLSPTNHECSQSREKHIFRPATDKEIKEYFS